MPRKLLCVLLVLLACRVSYGQNPLGGYTNTWLPACQPWSDGAIHSQSCPGATVDARINSAVTSIGPGNSGTIDSRGEGAVAQTIASTINLAATGQKVNLLLPCGAIWTATITNTTTVFAGAQESLISSNCQSLNDIVITLSNTASVTSIFRCGLDTSTTICENFGLKGVDVIGNTGAVVSNALIDTQGMFDSFFRDVHVGTCGNTKGFWVHAGTSTQGSHDISLVNVELSCSSTTGGQPFVVSRDSLTAPGGTGGVHIFGGDWGPAIAAQHVITLDGGVTSNISGVSNVDIHGLYIETHCGTNPIQINDVHDILLDNVLVLCIDGNTGPIVQLNESASGLTSDVTLINVEAPGTGLQAVNSNVPGCRTETQERAGYYYCFSNEQPTGWQVGVIGFNSVGQFQTYQNTTAPTCAVTGAGSTATCAIVSPSSDLAWVFVLTPGGTGIAANGTFTITAGKTFTNEYVCSPILRNSSNSWSTRASVIASSISGNQFVFNWDNNAVALTSGGSYQIFGVCLGF